MLFNLLLAVQATVIGIDFGTHWLKVSIIKPGGSLETVLNRESKRKTANQVTLRDGIRYYGSDSVTLGMRFPQDTFGSLKNVIGKPYEDPHSEDYRNTFPNQMSGDVRLNFTLTDKSQYIAEELVAMLLSHAKKMAETYSGVDVTGAVITVPPYFSHFERQQLMDAAEIAQLRVLGLLNDETAVAINFALGKKFPKKENHIFYDMGAGSTVAALVSLHSGSDPKQGIKNLVDIQVKGVGYDPTLGGQAVDVLLQNYLAQAFKKQHSKDITTNSRAMARFLKEANRVKTILSANQQVTASIENVVDGIDFKLAIKRSDLETLSDNVFSRTTGPVQLALESANATMDEVKSLILVGGGVRVPAVQSRLVKSIGEQNIARNVDGDEAAVLGAVLHCASLSSQFKLGTSFRIKDLNLNPVTVSYGTETKDKPIKTELFTDKSVLGSKKIMTFKRTTDFEVSVGYPTAPIAKIKVTGLTSAFEKFKDLYLEEPKVKILFQLSESGLLSFSDAHVSFSIVKQDSIKDKVMNFLGGKKEETEDQKNETKQDANKTVVEKVKLDLEIEWLTVPPLSTEQKNVMKARLSKMDAEDEERFAREAARNGLEAYIYKSKELLWDDDSLEYFVPSELESFKELVEKASEWLEDHGDAAGTAALKEQLNLLEPVHSKVQWRKKTYDLQSTYKERVEKVIANSRKLADIVKSNVPDSYTEEEADGFVKAIDAQEQWFKESFEKQETNPKSVDPLVTQEIVDERLTGLGISAKKLNPAIRIKPKTTQTTSQSTSQSKPTETPESSESAEPETPEKPESDSKETENGHNEL
ncbi:heat shock protein 70 family [Gorgonomyces haynaldii]|nr:heat shock protein 70 family [Gorgonomyces haynaldii]